MPIREFLQLAGQDRALHAYVFAAAPVAGVTPFASACALALMPFADFLVADVTAHGFRGLGVALPQNEPGLIAGHEFLCTIAPVDDSQLRDALYAGDRAEAMLPTLAHHSAEITKHREIA